MRSRIVAALAMALVLMGVLASDRRRPEMA